MKQNKFKSVGVLILIITTLFSIVACKNISENKVETKAPFFKISLAQWSFHRTFRSGETSPYDFAKMAHELGFEGLEYVSQLYPDVTKSSDKPLAIQNFVTKNNMLSAEYKMQNVLIMIDEEGDLSSSNEESRLTSIENHKLWIKAAHDMKCSSVRLNLYGEKDPEKWIENSN